MALGGGAAFYFSQQPRSIGGLVYTDSPDGRYLARGGAEHAMRIFGGDKFYYVFCVQGPDFVESWEVPVPYARLATNYTDRFYADYTFDQDHARIEWSDDSQRVSFLMRGIEVSAFNVVDHSHSSQPGYQPQREVELASNEDLRDCFLNLDTGRVLSAPRELLETLRARNQLAGGAPQSELVREWMRANGVDLRKQGAGRGLAQLDGVQIPVAEKVGSRADLRAFDTLTTNFVIKGVVAAEEALKDHDAQGNPRRFTLNAENVHAVKTREGAVALVEILEDNPRSGRTRLRYKLLKSSLNPGSAPAVPDFGPLHEVTLHDWDVQHEALDFETGRILVIPDEARKKLWAHNPDWFANTGVDLMTDTTRKGVGLLTLLTNELRLVKLAAEEWDSLTPAQLSEALSRGASGLTEVHEMQIGKVYVLQTNTPLPLTLGFRTGSGTEGVLQLTRFGEGSQPPVTLRYKLVQDAGSARTTAGPAEPLGSDPLQVAMKFLKAVEGGDVKGAWCLATTNYAARLGAGLKELRQTANLSRLRIASGWRQADHACVTTDFFPLRSQKQTQGALGISLVRESGAWRVRDWDSLPDERARQRFEARFKQSFPNAIRCDQAGHVPTSNRLDSAESAGVDDPAVTFLKPIPPETAVLLARVKALPESPAYAGKLDDTNAMQAFTRELSALTLEMNGKLRGTTAVPLIERINAQALVVKRAQENHDDAEVQRAVEQIKILGGQVEKMIEQAAAPSALAAPKPEPARADAVRASAIAAQAPFIAPAAPKPAALLQFRWIAEDRSTAPVDELPDPNDRSGQNRLRLLRDVFLDDAAVATATVGTNALGNAEITLHLTDEGARTLARVTDQKNGRRFAIVHQGRILSAPTVKGMLVGREVKIVGNFSAAEALRIVTALNQGRLPSHSAFGPVIERLVPLAFPETTNWFLDLETGTMLMPPPEFADAVTGRNDLLYWDNLTVIRKEQFAEWAKATGADLFVRSQESLETIGGIWALAQGPTPGRWDDLDALTLTQLEAAITTIETSRKDSERMERFGLGPRGMLHPRQSVNYFFKTRDGTLGVLQLAGTRDNPRGVKIRYKLVHDEGGNK